MHPSRRRAIKVARMVRFLRSPSLRVIADEFAGAKGPAKTFTPIHVWDLHLQSWLPFCIPLRDGYIALLVVLHSLSMS